MIPKIIHYCWFGGGQKSEKIRFCMESWKKFFPDYEIREWSEKDLYLFFDNAYVMEAYKAKKWAFVSDVFRLYALFCEGGIYLDTDVEIRRPFDAFLKHDFFIGSEKHGAFESIGTAVIGAVKGNVIIKEMLKLYQDIHFVKNDGTYDLLVNTLRLVPVLRQFGAGKVYSDNEIIKITDKAFIYPTGYFCVDNQESFAVHHFEASWEERYKRKFHFSLPVWPRFWLSFSKYKRVYPDSPFIYPVYCDKKLIDFDYKNKKFLLFIERFRFYRNFSSSWRITRKVEQYLQGNDYSLKVLGKIVFKAVNEYLRHLKKRCLRGADDGTCHILFKLGGGLGDILIALNYIEQFRDCFDKIDVSISVDEIFRKEVSELLAGHYKILGVSAEGSEAGYDVVISLVRAPKVEFIDKAKCALAPELEAFLEKIILFNKAHPLMFSAGTEGDFLLERYSLLQNRRRIGEADIEGLLSIKDRFKIHLHCDKLAVLKKFQLTKKFITLHRGVGIADGKERNKSTRLWNLAQYEKLVTFLKKEYPEVLLVQVGDLSSEIIKGVDVCLAGKTDFNELLVLLDEAQLHIDGECGMVHLRHFLSAKPSVVLFGPTNEAFYGYDENINIRPTLCPGCEWVAREWRTVCLRSNDNACCLNQVTAEDVLKTIRKGYSYENH
ncbi:MAG: hypothetical protein J6C85_07870 [Alphaproteobacteria bacterium]|nr:hypothetical protein [Alphaproteobacteria bacterium]